MIDDDLPQGQEDDAAELVESAQGDAAERATVERKAKRIARERRETDAFWRQTFASEIGRRAMWGLLQAGHWTETRFAVGPNGFPQVESTWFAAGEQALAQRLHDTWDIIDHEGVYRMKCEHDPRYANAPELRKQGGA